MASANAVPIPNTPALAAAALDADLPCVLRGRTLEDLGWKRPDRLTLLIPLVGVRHDGTRDDFLLRLNFLHYPEWPPSAQFVNPATQNYKYPEDACWLPTVDGAGEIAVHAQYDLPQSAGKIQLICASVTLEFYQVLHGVQDRHVWDPNVHNFAATIAAIERVLRPPHYKEPQKCPRKI